MLAGKESTANFGIVTETDNITRTKRKRKCLVFFYRYTFLYIISENPPLSWGFADINTELNTNELTQYRHLMQYQVHTCLFKNTATTQVFINSCIHVKAATLHMRTDAKYKCISSSGLLVVKIPATEGLLRGD